MLPTPFIPLFIHANYVIPFYQKILATNSIHLAYYLFPDFITDPKFLKKFFSVEALL